MAKAKAAGTIAKPTMFVAYQYQVDKGQIGFDHATIPLSSVKSMTDVPTLRRAIESQTKRTGVMVLSWQHWDTK